MLKTMSISKLTMDPITNSPIVILKEVDGDKTLPIWIGLMEATAIASKMEKIDFDRPMTHDLLNNILELVDAKVDKIEICDLKNNVYYALIHISHKDNTIKVDARPSDALALSLRVNAPIYVSEEVIDKSKHIDLMSAEPEVTTEEGKKWQEILENLNPEDFGKYKM